MSLPPLFCCHFPSFLKDSSVNGIDVCWYHPEFSQSRYPPGQKTSEACTLICLLVAQGLCEEGLLIRNVQNCPQLNIIMARAMVEGNATHARIIKQGFTSHPHLNIEEALKYGGRGLNTLNEWKYRIFYEGIDNTLYPNIKGFLNDWYKDPVAKNLFMLLITCGLTVLFIFQELTYKVTFFDPHRHNTIKNQRRGLVVAQTTIDKLESLCNWYTQDVLNNNYYKTEANEYELAFLYPRDRVENVEDSCVACKHFCMEARRGV